MRSGDGCQWWGCIDIRGQKVQSFQDNERKDISCNFQTRTLREISWTYGTAGADEEGADWRYDADDPTAIFDSAYECINIISDVLRP